MPSISGQSIEVEDVERHMPNEISEILNALNVIRVVVEMKGRNLDSFYTIKEEISDHSRSKKS